MVFFLCCLILLLIVTVLLLRMSAPSDLFTPDIPVPVVRHEVRDTVTGQFTPTPGKLPSTPSRSHKRKKPVVVAGESGVVPKVSSGSEGSSRDAKDRGKCSKGKGKTTKLRPLPAPLPLSLRFCHVFRRAFRTPGLRT